MAVMAPIQCCTQCPMPTSDYCAPCRQPTLRYIQPARRESFKPKIHYSKPNVPVESNTIYKNSYPCIDVEEALQCRLPPAKPIINLSVSNHVKMEDQTVTSMSYPGHNNIAKQLPIIPCPPSMLGEGPMQDLTTQKHDFVAKPSTKRPMIVPPEKMFHNTGPLEDETIQRLSFPKPDLSNFDAVVSCKPIAMYKKPDLPMDIETTQKLSYLPIAPSKRETPEWAVRSSFSMPKMPIDSVTTYKLSYLDNEKINRRKMCMPLNHGKLITTSRSFEDHTVYKQSYYAPPSSASGRQMPIRPTVNVDYKTNIKMDPNTMYKMSYQGHHGVTKQLPIIPCPRSMLGEGPMQDLTTQKHDFVDKPFSRRGLINPRNLMINSTCPLEKETTNRLSYMKPTQFVKSISCKPEVHSVPPSVPMDTMTTQKLSYQPVCAKMKEIFPWQRHAKFQMPQIAMETGTTQKLSFMPPGQFIEIDTVDCPCNIDGQCYPASFPRASDYCC